MSNQLTKRDLILSLKEAGRTDEEIAQSVNCTVDFVSNLTRQHRRERPRLDMFGPNDWSDYDAYCLAGGTMDYEDWRNMKQRDLQVGFYEPSLHFKMYREHIAVFDANKPVRGGDGELVALFGPSRAAGGSEEYVAQSEADARLFANAKKMRDHAAVLYAAAFAAYDIIEKAEGAQYKPFQVREMLNTALRAYEADEREESVHREEHGADNVGSQ